MCGNGFGVLHKRRFFHINEGFFINYGLINNSVSKAPTLGLFNTWAQ